MEPLDVLIVAAKNDPHAQAVAERITTLGARVRIFSLADLQAEQFTLEGGEVRAGPAHDPFVIGRRTSIWWRRPGSVPTAGLSEDDVRFVADEAPHVLRGALEAAQPRWVDEPFDVLRAEHKLFQLAVASSLKMPTPRTLVTNVVQTAASFIGVGPAIAKPLSPGYGIAPFTSAVSVGDAGQVEALPALLQEQVDASADVRVVVVGRSVFAWRRLRESDTLDWRAVDPSGKAFIRFENEKLAAASLAVTSGVGCTMGALDFLETEDGFVFLEINPRGQWLFLPEASEIVVAAVAEHLLQARRTDKGRWPSLWRRIWFDLLPAGKAPSADGSRPPEFEAPKWLAEVAAKPHALEVARRAHDDARESVRVAEEKAARFVQVGLTLVAVALAGAAYQATFAASRSGWWWTSLAPATIAVGFLALAVFGAAQVDRVAHYRVPYPSDLAGHRQQPEELVLLEIEERGRRRALWAANKKQTDLMQARASFTRGLIALLVAGVVAVGSLGLATSKDTTEPSPVIRETVPVSNP